MKRFIATVVFVGLLFGSVAVSFGGSILGYIREEVSKEYLSYVTVMLYQKQNVEPELYDWNFVDLRVTNENGFFAFNALEEGQYKISYGRHDCVWEWYQGVYDSTYAKIIKVEAYSTTMIIENILQKPLGLDVQPFTASSIPSSGGKTTLGVTVINRTEKSCSAVVTSQISNSSVYGATNTFAGPSLRYRVRAQLSQEKALTIYLPAEAPDGWYSMIVTVNNKDDVYNPYQSFYTGFYKGQ